MMAPAGENARGTENVPENVLEIEETIRVLRRTANRGPISLALFLGISIAVQQYSPVLVLPPEAARILGPAPAPSLISTALVFYAFFAILLILSRMTLAKGGCTALSHVGFLTGFYAFYQLAGALPDNFFPVLVAGFSIIGLETYHAWHFSRERIAEETEKLRQFKRLREWSAPSPSSPPPGENR